MKFAYIYHIILHSTTCCSLAWTYVIADQCLLMVYVGRKSQAESAWMMFRVRLHCACRFICFRLYVAVNDQWNVLPACSVLIVYCNNVNEWNDEYRSCQWQVGDRSHWYFLRRATVNQSDISRGCIWIMLTSGVRWMGKMLSCHFVLMCLVVCSFWSQILSWHRRKIIWILSHFISLDAC